MIDDLFEEVAAKKLTSNDVLQSVIYFVVEVSYYLTLQSAGHQAHEPKTLDLVKKIIEVKIDPHSDEFGISHEEQKKSSNLHLWNSFTSSNQKYF